MPVFIDQTGRSVNISHKATRIISLVPSQTELLHYLGLNEKVIGITKFCVHPIEWFSTKTKIGGTKKIQTELIRQLNPDLIIANKEENGKEQVEELSQNYPVWISDVFDFNSAFEMINQLGRITGTSETAINLVKEIQEKFSQLSSITSRLSACYIIWREPYMTIGGDTFISSMLEAAGFENIYKEQTRYPIINFDDIKSKNPEYILLSSEPFPFTQRHIDELKTHFPKTKIILVDGEMFSWYGSRLLHAPSYFLNLRQHGIY